MSAPALNVQAFRKVLVIKTSSLGDVIHTLPALSDAAQAYPNLRFDWVVEEAFQEIPRWHAKVDRVIPVALRRWRKTPYKSLVKNQEWNHFWRALRHEQYDMVIDAQGLLKSAWIAKSCRARVSAGFDSASARESLASWFYGQTHGVKKNEHAIQRVRQLFAQSLQYEHTSATPLDFGLQLDGLETNTVASVQIPYVLFLHGTTWSTKFWPEAHWITLGRWMNYQGYTVYLPWGNAEEEARAKRIAAQLSRAQVLPKLPLVGIAHYLQHAKLTVALDSGLTHLSAALNVPTVALFGATDFRKTGPKGQHQVTLKSSLNCAPCLKRHCRFLQQQESFALCMQALSPTQVWQQCSPYLQQPISVSVKSMGDALHE